MNAQAFSHVFHIGLDALGVNGPFLSRQNLDGVNHTVYSEGGSKS